jgi:hypothetical protein
MNTSRVLSPESNSRRALWPRLTLGLCTLLFVLGGCGGGDAPANNGAAQIPSMKGDRTSTEDAWVPAVDVSKAPTKEHGKLAGLVPNVDRALLKDSVKYGNWRADTSEFDPSDAINATLPTVGADYRSTGYTITADPNTEEGSVKQEYIQTCRLFLIKAPEGGAAQPIVDKIAANLTAKGFKGITELEWADGVDKTQTIQRYSRIDANNDVDDVYVAYIKIVGDIVIYALEAEAAPKTTGPGDLQLSRVTDAGLGSRVGGQLTFLVAEHLINP